MIFKLLSAYEEEILKGTSFFRNIKRMIVWKKVLLIVMISLTMGWLYVGFFVENKAVVLIYLGVYLLFSLVADILFKVDRRKNYIKSLIEYNKRLDKLDSIIMKEEFAITTAKRLEALIAKIKAYLEQVKSDEMEKKESRGQWYTVIIVPMLAFVLGTIASQLSAGQVAVYGGISLILAMLLRFSVTQIMETAKQIFESRVINMKYLLEELQDLYDRKYID